MLTVVADILRMNVSRSQIGDKVIGKVSKKMLLPTLGVDIILSTEIIGSCVHNDGAVVLYKIGEELAVVLHADDAKGMARVAVIGGLDNIVRLQEGFTQRTVQSFKAALKVAGKAVVARYERDYHEGDWSISASG